MTVSTQLEVVRYRSSAVRCPDCRHWRDELVIEPDGTLRCADCPAVRRRRKSRRKGVAA